jgi:hypothetical protein
MMGRKPQREVYGQVTFFGAPDIPLIPEKDFDNVVKEYKEFKEMWEIIGPTLHINLKRDVPLWKAVTMCYMQGIKNGMKITVDMIESGRMDVKLPEKPAISNEDIIGGALSG